LRANPGYHDLPEDVLKVLKPDKSLSSSCGARKIVILDYENYNAKITKSCSSLKNWKCRRYMDAKLTLTKSEKIVTILLPTPNLGAVGDQLNKM